MEYVIDDFNKANFNSKFDRIIEARYRTEKADTPNKKMRAFYSAYKEKYPHDKFDIGSSVRQWRSFKSNQLPKIEYLMKLCSVLDCDIDYFLTDQDDFRKDIAGAADVIGLDYITVEAISELTNSEKHILDAIFSRTNVSFNLIKLIKQMLFYSHPHTRNNTHITLDNGLTKRDKDYYELESKINDYEIIEMLSYRLSIEMNEIIKSLCTDKKLSDEIYLDYKSKFFSAHKRIISADELPMLTTSNNGNVILDTSREIERIEKKILNRLSEREEIGNNFDYQIEGMNNTTDFSAMIQDKRLSMTESDYLTWLNEIEKKTR